MLIEVDNSVAYSYLRKGGGKVQALNQKLRPLLQWCKDHQVHLVPSLVPSAQMRADAVSRWSVDKGEVSLNPHIFWSLVDRFPRPPEVDLFASPNNHLLDRFCTRWPHHQAAAVDALACPLEGFE